MILNFKTSSMGLIPNSEATSKHLRKYEQGAEIDLEVIPESTGTVSMLRTWRMWMKETAIFMRHHGCTMPLFIDKHGMPKGTRPYNADDAHEQFTSVYLGRDEQGRRKSWSISKDPDVTQASMADRLWAMDTHLDWCTEKGITLTIPKKNSEYVKEKAKAKEQEL